MCLIIHLQKSWKFNSWLLWVYMTWFYMWLWHKHILNWLSFLPCLIFPLSHCVPKNISHIDYTCLNLGFSIYFRVILNWAESKKSLAHTKILDFSLWKLPGMQILYGAIRNKGFPGGTSPPTNAGAIRKAGWIPESGRSLKGMVTHSSILGWRIPWTDEVWQATIHGVPESDMTEVT